MISWNLSWAMMLRRSSAATPALAVGQTQTASNGVFDQRAGVSGAQRHDDVEAGHVPACFEHVDVNDDLGRLVHAFHRQQLPGVRGITRNHQHEGFDHLHVVLTGIGWAAPPWSFHAAVCRLPSLPGFSSWSNAVTHCDKAHRAVSQTGQLLEGRGVLE